MGIDRPGEQDTVVSLQNRFVEQARGEIVQLRVQGAIREV